MYVLFRFYHIVFVLYGNQFTSLLRGYLCFVHTFSFEELFSFCRGYLREVLSCVFALRMLRYHSKAYMDDGKLLVVGDVLLPCQSGNSVGLFLCKWGPPGSSPGLACALPTEHDVDEL